MDVATHRSRARNVSPFQGVTMRQSGDIILKDGDLFVHDVFSTSTVNPNGTVDVSLTVSNGAASVSPGADCCGPFCNDAIPGGWGSNGWEYTVSAELDGEVREDPAQCLGTTEVGTNDRTHNFSFPAPGQRGSYDISITLELPGSGEKGTITRQVQVQTGGGDRPGPDDCQDDSDCPENWGCEDGRCVPSSTSGEGAWLPCLLDPGRACSGPDMIMQVILFAVILVLVVG